MTIFDRALQYQFVAFTSALPREKLPTDLGPVLQRPAEGVPGLGLKLGPAADTLFTAIPGDAPSSTGRLWRDASGLWRAHWSPERLDVFFNARGYADVREEADVCDLDVVRKRLAANLLAACEASGQRVTRVATVVTGDSSCPGSRNAQIVLASLYLNEEAKRMAAEGKAVDLMARVNFQDEWILTRPDGTRQPLLVNRLQTASAIGVARGDAVDTYLNLQFDVNSGAAHDLGELVGAAEILQFFEKAVAWTSSRLKEIEAVACNR